MFHQKLYAHENNLLRKKHRAHDSNHNHSGMLRPNRRGVFLIAVLLSWWPFNAQPFVELRSVSSSFRRIFGSSIVHRLEKQSISGVGYLLLLSSITSTYHCHHFVSRRPRAFFSLRHRKCVSCSVPLLAVALLVGRRKHELCALKILNEPLFRPR